MQHIRLLVALVLVGVHWVPTARARSLDRVVRWWRLANYDRTILGQEGYLSLNGTFGDPTSDTGVAIKKDIQSDVKWDPVSQLPLLVQYIFASVWIGIIGSLPIAQRVLKSYVATYTEVTLSCLLWMTLFGGLFLCTSTLQFDSKHFQAPRTLTIVECVYLFAQVQATVGYGDITPVDPEGMLFIVCYILVCFCVIGNVFSNVLQAVMDQSENYARSLRVAPEQVNFHQALGLPTRPTSSKLIIALIIFLINEATFISFFYTYPGESKTFFQSQYFSLITLTTTGFGYFTPTTEMGLVFDSFCMLFGSFALVNLASELANYVMHSEKYEQFTVEACQQRVEELQQAAHHRDVMSAAEFLRFSLVSQELVPSAEFDRLFELFQSCDPSKGGTVKFERVERLVSDSILIHGSTSKDKEIIMVKESSSPLSKSRLRRASTREALLGTFGFASEEERNVSPTR